MKKNEQKSLVLIIIFVLFLAGIVAYVFVGLQSSDGTGGSNPPLLGKMCPADAKICPDGSSVSRKGPKCDFEPCPGKKDFKVVGDPTDAICKNMCGDGKCAQVVCLGENCPCAETAQNCATDCPRE